MLGVIIIILLVMVEDGVVGVNLEVRRLDWVVVRRGVLRIWYGGNNKVDVQEVEWVDFGEYGIGVLGQGSVESNFQV